MIASTLETTENRALYGNILGAGYLMGMYGLRKNSEMAARFAFMSAVDGYKVKMDPKLNSLDAVAQWMENEEEAVRTRILERGVERHSENTNE